MSFARSQLTPVGSVRTLREVVEDGQTTNLTTRLGGYDADSVWLTRTWIGGTAQYLGLFAGNNTQLDVRPAAAPAGFPSVNISRLNPGRNASVKFESTFNLTSSLRGLGMDDLLAPEGDTEIIQAIRAAPEVVDQLAFLAYESEFLAGGWRFLTCKLISSPADADFGRDTLLAMQVLLPVLSPRACEAILAGVIQRTGPDGELCHEETVSLDTLLANPDRRVREHPQHPRWAARARRSAGVRLQDGRYGLPPAPSARGVCRALSRARQESHGAQEHIGPRKLWGPRAA